MADPDQDAASDRVNHALCGVQTGNQKEQRDQCRHASARQNAVINFEHEQRAGEHQKIAHAAEDGDRDKGSPARTECGCKFRTGRLLLRRSEGRIHKDCVPLLRTQNHARAVKVRRSAILARRGAFALNATIMDLIYPHYTRFGRVHDPLVNWQGWQTGLSPWVSAPMCRRDATAKPLQSNDLLPNRGRNKTTIGAPSPIAFACSGPISERRSHGRRSGFLPGRRLRLR
jgi:hypothetical protein